MEIARLEDAGFGIFHRGFGRIYKQITESNEGTDAWGYSACHSTSSLFTAVVLLAQLMARLCSPSSSLARRTAGDRERQRAIALARSSWGAGSESGAALMCEGTDSLNLVLRAAARGGASAPNKRPKCWCGLCQQCSNDGDGVRRR